jgi:hypothetical protein
MLVTKILQMEFSIHLFPIWSSIEIVLHKTLLLIKSMPYICNTYPSQKPYPHSLPTISMHPNKAWRGSHSRWPGGLLHFVPARGSASIVSRSGGSMPSFPIYLVLVPSGRRWPNNRDRRRSPSDVCGSGWLREHMDSSSACSSGGGRCICGRHF